MGKLIECLGKIGIILLICLLSPVILMVIGALLGMVSVTLSTVGSIFLVLFPGIIIGIIIGNSMKD